MTKSMVALQRMIDMSNDGVAYVKLRAFIEEIDTEEYSEDTDAKFVKDALDSVGRLIKLTSEGTID